MTRKPRRRRAGKRPPRKKKPTRRDPLDDFIAAGSRALDLKIADAWLAMVRMQLQLIVQHGARVAEFALPDDAEPAPVFKA